MPSFATVPGYQIRKKEMLNESGRGDATACPATEEVRTCSLESCYHWSAQPTGQCDLPPSGRSCGSGSQYQTVTCVRWDGAIAADPVSTVSLSSCLYCTLFVKNMDQTQSGWLKCWSCTFPLDLKFQMFLFHPP